MHNSGAKRIDDANRRATITLECVARAVANTLYKTDDETRFNVSFRFYHGWHAGITPTANRVALGKLENDPDFKFPNFKNIRFLPTFGYGETLLQALPHRLRSKAPVIHLPDTYRAPIGDDDKWREKMVDSAMVCDILVHARLNPTEWRVVLAEDDDVVPALFVAEAWSKGRGAKNLLVRKREQNKHIVLDGLLREFTA